MKLSEKAFLVDSTKCIGCFSCQVACKAWNELPPENNDDFSGIEYNHPGKLTAVTWNRVVFDQCDYNNGFNWQIFHQKCNHCTDANCYNVCPEKAIYKYNGWVLVNQDKCIGCGECEKACVYGAITLSKNNFKDSIKRNRAYKCHGCVVINKKDIPVCASQCPTGALIYDYRVKLIKKAHKRLKEIKGDYPEANLYGVDQFKGLNVLTLLKYKKNIIQTTLNSPIIRNKNDAYYIFSRFLPPLRALRHKSYKLYKKIIG